MINATEIYLEMSFAYIIYISLTFTYSIVKCKLQSIPGLQGMNTFPWLFLDFIQEPGADMSGTGYMCQ